MGQRQQDWTTEMKPYFAEKIKRKLGNQESFGTVDVALVFDVSENFVREWIEEGRLAAVDLNAGRTTWVDRAQTALGRRPMRPYYRIEREAIIDLANRMERGF